MLFFAGWQKALVLIVCLGGLFMASPNLFFDTVEQSNAGEDQLVRAAAGDLTLTQEARVAAEADAGVWPSFMPDGLVNLGLDLRGGVHLLVEVSLEDVHDKRLDSIWSESLRALRARKDDVGRFRRIEGTPGQLQIRFDTAEAAGLARGIVAGLGQPVDGGLLGPAGSDIEASVEARVVTVTLSDAAKTGIDQRTMAQSIEIVRRRIDASGTKEPTIQRQGERRIVVQVPGAGSAEEILELLGTTAKLDFHMVESAAADAGTRPGPGRILVPDAEDAARYYVLDRIPLVSGESLTDAQPGFDQQTGEPVVTFRFDTSGARKFGRATAENVGRLFAVVLDGEVITAPQIREPITGGSGQISGSFTVESANRLAILLRAGALPAEIQVLEQRTVGPELGQDSIDAGTLACIVAFIAVLVFMALSYGRFGIFADIALIVNVGLIIGALTMIGATLTLPGIAGIVLTIGMAVDANVLIFERIREELRRTKGVAKAIETGYSRAFSAIIDANVTTFIAAIILFSMGSGPVQGFAVTLGIGIVTSVFTAVMVTRLMVATWFHAARPKTLEV